MFLHIGSNNVVSKKDILSILDYRLGFSNITKEFIKTARNEGFLISIADLGKEKSYVITIDKIYVSPISCSTLKKRFLSALGNEE